MGLLVDPRLGSVVVAIEAILKRERIGYLELFPYYDTSCPELAGVNDKAARWKTDELGSAREQSWQQSHLRPG